MLRRSRQANKPRAGAILRWLPAIAWMALIFFLSSRSDLPHAPEHWLDVLWKKGAHLCAYAILAILYERALALPRRGKLAALGLTVLYAISDEFHQSFTPGRTPLATDVLIDTAGAFVALYVLGRGPFIGGRARSLRDHHDQTGDAPSA
jgi:VanZ family protein